VRVARQARAVPVRPWPPRQPSSTISPRRARSSASAKAARKLSMSAGTPKSGHSTWVHPRHFSGARPAVGSSRVSRRGAHEPHDEGGGRPPVRVRRGSGSRTRVRAHTTLQEPPGTRQGSGTRRRLSTPPTCHRLVAPIRCCARTIYERCARRSRHPLPKRRAPQTGASARQPAFGGASTARKQARRRLAR
jgi:hypothetical protein